MKKKISFYKEDGSWYADVPFIPKANNLMVAGADTFLETISNGSDRLTLTIETSSRKILKPLFLLTRTNHDFWGAEYEIWSFDKAEWTAHFPILPKLWLCNVTHFVLGRHPKYISIIKIDRQ